MAAFQSRVCGPVHGGIRHSDCGVDDQGITDNIGQGQLVAQLLDEYLPGLLPSMQFHEVPSVAHPSG